MRWTRSGPVIGGICLGLLLTLGSTRADDINPFELKPPDPFKQDAIPLPPPLSPKDLPAARIQTQDIAQPPGAAPGRPPVIALPASGPGMRALTEDDAYASYQRGLFIAAFALATELAEKGDPQAMTMVGHLYDVGQGVRTDPARAAMWYGLAADRGDPEAQVALATLYLSGRGVKVDKKRALDLFEAAAKRDQATALFNLAVFTLDGDVIKADPERARSLMRRSAELGNAEAAYSYALMLDGANQPGTDVETTFWLGYAARLGNVAAEIEYGIRLANGRGAPKDVDTAALFLNRAAWTGNPIAQNRIARMIATGIGMPFNDVEAAKWHILAKAGGVQDPELEDMLATMKPADIERAKVLAANWPDVTITPMPTGFHPNGVDDQQFELHSPVELQHKPPQLR